MLYVMLWDIHEEKQLKGVKVSMDLYSVLELIYCQSIICSIYGTGLFCSFICFTNSCPWSIKWEGRFMKEVIYRQLTCCLKVSFKSMPGLSSVHTFLTQEIAISNFFPGWSELGLFSAALLREFKDSRSHPSPLNLGFYPDSRSPSPAPAVPHSPTVADTHIQIPFNFTAQGNRTVPFPQDKAQQDIWTAEQRKKVEEAAEPPSLAAFCQKISISLSWRWIWN